MTFIIDIPPAEEPVSLAEVKTRLRIDHAHDDALISRLIRAARLHIEGAANLALVSRTLTAYLPLPHAGPLSVAIWPLSAVLSVSLLRDGQASLLSADAYEVDLVAKPCRLHLKRGSLLTARDDITMAVQMVAGFGAASDVPADLAEAVLQLACEWYAPGEGLAPDAVARMVAPYREVRLCR